MYPNIDNYLNSVRKELLDNFNSQVRCFASAFTNKHSLILQNGIYYSVVKAWSTIRWPHIFHFRRRKNQSHIGSHLSPGLPDFVPVFPVISTWYIVVQKTAWSTSSAHPQPKRTLTTKSSDFNHDEQNSCLLYTSPSPRDATLSRMPSSA